MISPDQLAALVAQQVAEQLKIYKLANDGVVGGDTRFSKQGTKVVGPASSSDGDVEVGNARNECKNEKQSAVVRGASSKEGARDVGLTKKTKKLSLKKIERKKRKEKAERLAVLSCIRRCLAGYTISN